MPWHTQGTDEQYRALRASPGRWIYKRRSDEHQESPLQYIATGYIWGFKLTWPYRFSHVHNKFISIGCNTIGYIYNTNGRTRDATGCASVCGSPEDLTNGLCVGVGCYQNVVPKGFMGCNVYFYDVDYVNTSNSWYFNPCSYVGLVETEAFVFNSDYVTTTMFNDTYKGRQPVVLD